ncbi:fibroin heavy chain isoform X1 [Scomber scombrus]|uniref:Fibroin heavy chain isoform X1 n=1 Tax=Scomber scombrus TaxID=13677 RepID=A0AAV1NNH7_SCOSC
MGYPGARPGMSAADLGGSEMAALGQAVQDLKRAKSRVFGSLFLGKQERTQDNMRRSGILGPNAPELHAGTGFRPAVQSPGPATFPDKQGKSLGLGVSPAQGQGIYPFGVPKRKGTPSHGATLATGGVRQPQPVDEDIIRNQGISRNYDPSVQQGQQTKNCGSTRDLSDELEKYRQLLASEAQRTQSSGPQPRSGEDSRHLGLATPQAQGEEAYRLLQSQDAKTDIFSLPPGQGTGVYSSPTADRQGVEHLRLAGKDSGGLSGTVVAENLNRGSANPQVQRVESDVPVIPGESGTKSLGVATAGGRKEIKGPFNAEHDGREPKALSIPEQTGRNTQGTSFGAGPYPGGAGLGAGGYGPGLGQGAYLGGAAGKLGGYGEGVTGYHGGAGNGFGYGNGNGNGYADPYGTALGTGAYAGHPQGAYGTGLDAPAGKYGGGAGHAPYGGAPVIPTGLEGEVGYPYGAQQLSSVGESAKTASKHGYGAQLGAGQEMLGEHVGKYGYKGENERRFRNSA